MSGFLSSGIVNATAIPDSGLLHNWDARKLSSVSTFTDQAGSADLSASGDPQLISDGINGNQVVRLDAGDYWSGTGVTQSQPVEIFVVADNNGSSGSGDDYYLHSTNQTGQHPRAAWNDSWILDAGTILSGGSFESAAALYRLLIDGSNSEISVARSVVASGDAGADGFGGTFYLGSNSGISGTSWIGDIGQMLVYDPSASGYSRSDVLSYINSEWGV
jgi:hypothetical protein